MIPVLLLVIPIVVGVGLFLYCGKKEEAASEGYYARITSRPKMTKKVVIVRKNNGHVIRPKIEEVEDDVSPEEITKFDKLPEADSIEIDDGVVRFKKGWHYYTEDVYDVRNGNSIEVYECIGRRGIKTVIANFMDYHRKDAGCDSDIYALGWRTIKIVDGVETVAKGVLRADKFLNDSLSRAYLNIVRESDKQGRKTHLMEGGSPTVQVYTNPSISLAELEMNAQGVIVAKSECIVERKTPVKSIYEMSDADLESKFGDKWNVAKDIIEARRDAIRSGKETNWEAVRQSWDRSELATDGQIGMLKAFGISYDSTMTKYRASYLLDEVLLESDVKKEVERREKRAAKQAERDALRYATKKPRDLKIMMRHRSEFTNLWNAILDDNVIEVDELLQVKTWLKRHKRSMAEFNEMLTLIDNVIEDGVIDEQECQQLYEAAVKVIEYLSGEDNVE